MRRVTGRVPGCALSAACAARRGHRLNIWSPIQAMRWAIGCPRRTGAAAPAVVTATRSPGRRATAAGAAAGRIRLTDAAEPPRIRAWPETRPGGDRACCGNWEHHPSMSRSASRCLPARPLPSTVVSRRMLLRVALTTYVCPTCVVYPVLTPLPGLRCAAPSVRRHPVAGPPPLWRRRPARPKGAGGSAHLGAVAHPPAVPACGGDIYAGTHIHTTFLYHVGRAWRGSGHPAGEPRPWKPATAAGGIRGRRCGRRQARVLPPGTGDGRLRFCPKLTSVDDCSNRIRRIRGVEWARILGQPAPLTKVVVASE